MIRTLTERIFRLNWNSDKMPVMKPAPLKVGVKDVFVLYGIVNVVKDKLKGRVVQRGCEKLLKFGLLELSDEVEGGY
jgi:hypothetical protein